VLRLHHSHPLPPAAGEGSHLPIPLIHTTSARRPSRRRGGHHAGPRRVGRQLLSGRCGVGGGWVPGSALEVDLPVGAGAADLGRVMGEAGEGRRDCERRRGWG
jgi:hypothetical protein